MRFLKRTLPHIAISLNLALMIVIYLDMRNPMMGFLMGAPFVVLAACCCISSIVSAITLYATYRKSISQKQPVSQQKNLH